MAQIKTKVQSGEYEVDPVAVATAILQRLNEMAVAHAERLAAAERSNHRTA